mmetsp:Transcript_33443/g.55994  ORF Transcript_33443/g.55994 Transcript_33443/m.55994 type:complete len:101 (-) Transcript_33443:193-495(-)
MAHCSLGRTVRRLLSIQAAITATPIPIETQRPVATLHQGSGARRGASHTGEKVGFPKRSECKEGARRAVLRGCSLAKCEEDIGNALLGTTRAVVDGTTGN